MFQTECFQHIFAKTISGMRALSLFTLMAVRRLSKVSHKQKVRYMPSHAIKERSIIFTDRTN
jgi:hypothetical protein